MIPRSLSLVALLALAGCDMAPRYVRPAMPVPAALPAAGDGAATANPADVAWRDFFVDDRLRRLIALALDNNRDLRVAVANVAAARAQYHVQRAGILPTIGVSGAPTYQKTPAGLGSVASTAGQAAGSATRADIYQANVGVSAWEIDLFGRIRDLTKASQEQFFAVQENRNAAQTALVAEVATAWLTLAADQDRLRLAQDTAKAYGETYRLTQARFANRVASELEVRQAQTSYDSARADIAQTRTQVAQDTNALNLLAGTTVAADMVPQELSDATRDALPEGLPSEVLLRRPDVASAEHVLRAANANIGAARAAFFPKVSLTAAFGSLSLGLSNLFGSGSQYWSVAPTATVPIFDFGKNQGNLRYAQATRDAQVATYEKSVQTAFREVADALAQRANIGAQLEAQTSQRDAAAVAYRLAEARFREGVDPFLTTLDSQRSLYTAQQTLLSVRLTRQTNLVELYRALGGGLT